MPHRTSIAAVIAMATLCATLVGAQAFDDAKYPDLKGQWHRVTPQRWESSGQKAPLTPEYRAVYEANQADMAAGGPGDMASWYCLPQGMPMMMSLYDPMEIVVTPGITYILISHVNDSYRRIYTDGRDWPAEGEYELTFAGYSIGKWIDEDGDGRYDVLEAETRYFKGPRAYDASGLPLHSDNQSVFKERFFIDKTKADIIHVLTTVIDHALTRPWTSDRQYRRVAEKVEQWIYLDKADRNILYNEITVFDHALTRPWSVTKKARRDPKAKSFWQTAVCAENNSMVRIGKDPYYMSLDGYLMPTKKNQPPPDLRYFNQPRK